MIFLAGAPILAAASVFLGAAVWPLAAQEPPAPEPPVQSQATDGSCPAPDGFTHPEEKLTRVARRVKDGKRLDILVIGTGSSGLGRAQGGADSSYPARLQAALAERLPSVPVSVRTNVLARRTAADMANAIHALEATAVPGLLVWQTGTVDAIRGVDPDAFRETLEETIKHLHASGVDVLLVNMQYSPRTQGMIADAPYADAMRWISQQMGVPVFDRLALMQYWSEKGVFDFAHEDRTRIAERVHECLGRLMAELIIDAAGLKKKAKHN